jgi:hypothetical protein
MTGRLLLLAPLLAAALVACDHEKPSEAALRQVGAAAGESCAPVVDVPPSGASDHRNGEIVYDREPPSSGPHAPNWVTVFRRVYTTDDLPPVEQWVHNLEHGWVVVWYAPDAPTDVLTQALEAANTRKLVAVPWTRGTLPTPYVLTAWGHEQRCTAVSGAAIAAFLDEHGGENGDAPEPTAP